MGHKVSRALLVLASVLLAGFGALYPEHSEYAYSLAAMVFGAGVIRRPGDKAPPDAASPTEVLLFIGLALGACTPAQQALATKALTAADAVGVTTARVLGWCRDSGADQTTLERAQQAYEQKDFREAMSLAVRMVNQLRDAGHPPPEELEASMVTAAMAVQGMEDGLRALHQ